MSDLTDALRMIHLVTAALMVWPLYALVVVNQRAHLGPPIGDRADTYLENIVKNRTIPCFVFQATAFVTGVWLIIEYQLDTGDVLDNPRLVIKFVLLAFVTSLLGYVHMRLQPQIDAGFANLGSPPDPAVVATLGRLRLFRKRLALVCLSTVLVMIVLGAQVWQPFSTWLTIVMLIAVGAFAYQAYRSEGKFGWF
jgi:hypothetical protein